METLNIVYDLLVAGVLVWLLYEVTGLQQDLQDEVDFNNAVGESQRYVNTKLESSIALLEENTDTQFNAMKDLNERITLLAKDILELQVQIRGLDHFQEDLVFQINKSQTKGKKAKK